MQCVHKVHGKYNMNFYFLATTKHDLELIARHEIMAALGTLKWRNDHFATFFPANGLKEQKDDGPEFGIELLAMCEKNSVSAQLY